MKKQWLVLLFIIKSIEVHAEPEACQLPFSLVGYTLFSKVSGMDYKTDLNTMSFRKLSFFDKKLNNQSMISGEMFTAFYTYRRLSNEIAFINVYQNPELTILFYRDVLFCETDSVGKLIFTPNIPISFKGFSHKQLTAKYVLKKGGTSVNENKGGK